jgi:hypothetical protein
MAYFFIWKSLISSPTSGWKLLNVGLSPPQFAAAAQQKKIPGDSWKRDFKSVCICGFIFPIKDFQLKKYPIVGAARLRISVNLR